MAIDSRAWGQTSMEGVAGASGAGGPEWGSDVIADVISGLDIPYVTILPASSSRGFHDSIVNYKGNKNPQLLLCLHEEAIVAIAHGYAKVTERPMAAAVYANVGLMHATMAVFNAYCDRVPMLILGFNGAIDGAQRRPWIDWIHTTTDIGALIRQYVKFDDSPMSLESSVEGLLSCYQRTITEPFAPTYIRLDTGPLEEKVNPGDYGYIKALGNKPLSTAISAEPRDVIEVQKLLRAASKPVFLFGRTGRSTEAWVNRQKLIVQSGAIAVGDIKQPSAVQSTLKNNVCAPSMHNAPETMQVLVNADLIISFDWVDLAGTLKTAFPDPHTPRPNVVHVSLDHLLHNGWSNDRFGFTSVNKHIQTAPDVFVHRLLTEKVDSEQSSSQWTFDSQLRVIPESQLCGEHISMRRLAHAVNTTINPLEMCLIRAPLAWDGSDLVMEHPLAFLGMDGGAGVGSGPGMAVGAALALRDHYQDLLPVAILGDGDYFMGATALWTAARNRIPLLVIVANNVSFYNDEIHQERIAKTRGRPVENKGIGIRIEDPEPDVSKIAESMGLMTLGGQVKKAAELTEKIADAVKLVKEGKAVVVDVRVIME